jgi:hypothetical protein
MKIKNWKLAISFTLGLLFFVLGIITLPHYGINWDTINHLPRGQFYLHYFLTGEKDYLSLPAPEPYWQDPSTLAIKTNVKANNINYRSLYQIPGFTYNFLMSWDGGHPPLSDILSSLFNRILFGKMHLINDIDSYRVYGVLLAAALVGLMFYWSVEISGFWGGIVSAVSLFLYPLFWSESHFNTQKDIPETVYWSFFIFAVYRGFTRSSWRWILLSSLFCGLALGTKFNILFSIFVLIPWVIYYVFCNKKTGLSVFSNLKNQIKVWMAFLLVPVIAFLILVSTWPYLWQDVISGLVKVFGYYEGIGTTGAGGGIEKLFEYNTYPFKWIFFTTPVVTLIFAVIGFIVSVFNLKKDRNKLELLFLLWFIVPIARVTIGGTVVYGGIRQIMEYVPALALLAGVGAGWLIKFCSQRFKLCPYILGTIALLAFIPITVKLYKIHPNENVYFNFLIRGLQGAKNSKITSWGNSFGAAYRQGVLWINKNAEPNSKLVFASELMPNIPSIWIRSDISFSNTHRSGFIRDGEYAITLTYDGTAERTYYDRYLETVLDPVYEVKVDGVSILKVWKNDLEHTKTKFKNQIPLTTIKWTVVLGKIEADLGKEANLSYLDISFKEAGGCGKLTSGAVSLSRDRKDWNYMKDLLPTGQISIYKQQPSENRLVYSFLGERARYVKIEYLPIGACLAEFLNGEVFQIPDI